jgi:hypothetical protein
MSFNGICGLSFVLSVCKEIIKLSTLHVYFIYSFMTFLFYNSIKVSKFSMVYLLIKDGTLYRIKRKSIISSGIKN